MLTMGRKWKHCGNLVAFAAFKQHQKQKKLNGSNSYNIKGDANMENTKRNIIENGT